MYPFGTSQFGTSIGAQISFQQSVRIQASGGAFAAILRDGRVVTWGDPDKGQERKTGWLSTPFLKTKQCKTSSFQNPNPKKKSSLEARDDHSGLAGLTNLVDQAETSEAFYLSRISAEELKLKHQKHIPYILQWLQCQTSFIRMKWCGSCGTKQDGYGSKTLGTNKTPLVKRKHEDPKKRGPQGFSLPTAISTNQKTTRKPHSKTPHQQSEPSYRWQFCARSSTVGKCQRDPSDKGCLCFLEQTLWLLPAFWSVWWRAWMIFIGVFVGVC